jgi:uncharacterized membrane protein YkoI
LGPEDQENVMRRLIGWLGASAVVVAMLVLATAARADDKAQKIAPDKLPQKIKNAINGRFPGAEVTSAEKEVENNQVVYDIELKHKGRKYEMDIKEDGTILEIEKEVATKDVPAALPKAVQARFPKATIKEVMEVNKVEGKKETPQHYEVTIETADKKKMEVIVSLDGKSVKTEAELKKEKEKK